MNLTAKLKLIAAGCTIMFVLAMTNAYAGESNRTPPPPLKVSGMAVPTPSGGVVGGVAHPGGTTMIQHQPFSGGSSTTLQHSNPGGSGFGGEVAVDQGKVVGVGASVKLSFP